MSQNAEDYAGKEIEYVLFGSEQVDRDKGRVPGERGDPYYEANLRDPIRLARQRIAQYTSGECFCHGGPKLPYEQLAQWDRSSIRGT